MRGGNKKWPGKAAKVSAYGVWGSKPLGVAMRGLNVALALAATMGLAPMTAIAEPLSAAADPSAIFRLIALKGSAVKWGGPQMGTGATVTYAFATAPVAFSEARNCRAMEPVGELLAREDSELPVELLPLLDSIRFGSRQGGGLGAHVRLHPGIGGVLEEAVGIVHRHAPVGVGDDLRRGRRRHFDPGEGGGERAGGQREEQQDPYRCGEGHAGSPRFSRG